MQWTPGPVLLKLSQTIRGVLDLNFKKHSGNDNTKIHRIMCAFFVCQLKPLKHHVVKQKLTSKQTDRCLKDTMDLNVKR